MTECVISNCLTLERTTSFLMHYNFFQHFIKHCQVCEETNVCASNNIPYLVYFVLIFV